MESFFEQYKHNLKDIWELIKTNAISFIWLFIVHLLGIHFIGKWSQILFYAILCFIFLPNSEKIYTKLRGLRVLETLKDIERIEIIYNEVYERAKEKTSWLEVELYILNSMDITVQAYGSHTLIVSQGALEMYNRNQLKGLLAHEFGRIASGYTKSVLINNMANKTFFIIAFLIQLASILFELSVMAGASIFFGSLLYGIFPIIFILFAVVSFIVIWFINNMVDIILAINSRSNALISDQYAYDIGYDEELTSALYLIRQMSIEKKSLLKRLKTADPHINKRIALLEAET